MVFFFFNTCLLCVIKVGTFPLQLLSSFFFILFSIYTLRHFLIYIIILNYVLYL